MAGRKNKHNMSRTRLYNCWSAMKTRCNAKHGNAYRWYASRGVSYCDEWEDFVPFMNWALSHGYSDNLTLDRIDNDGNYEPSNCRWATQHEQSMNKRHLPNKTGFVGVRAHYHKDSHGEKKLDGYSCYVYRFYKEKYIGHALTAEGAFRIREEYLRGCEE